MAYTKNPTWVDGTAGGTLITADALNHIEDGIAAAASAPPRFGSSQEIRLNGGQATQQSQSSAGWMRLVPLLIDAPVTIDQLGLNIGAGSSAQIQMSVWTIAGGVWTRQVYVGIIDATGGGLKYLTLPAALTVTPGVWFVGVKPSLEVTMMTLAAGSPLPMPLYSDGGVPGYDGIDASTTSTITGYPGANGFGSLAIYARTV